MKVKISGGTEMERLLAVAYYAVTFKIREIGEDNVYTMEELKNGDIECIIHIPISNTYANVIMASAACINKAAEEHGSDIHVEAFS